MRVLSVVGFLMMGGGAMGLLLSHALFSPHPVVIAVQAAAFLLMVWARVTFGSRSFHAAADPTEGGLVTSGPYAFVRHPIYTSVCAFIVAGALANFRWATLGFAAAVLAGAAIRMFLEERLLVKRYPEYAEYARRVRRMIPHIL